MPDGAGRRRRAIMNKTAIGWDILVALVLAAAVYGVVIGVGTPPEGGASKAVDIPAVLLGVLSGLLWFVGRRWRAASRRAAAARQDETLHRRLREALETLPVGVVFYDRDDRVAFCNSQFRRLNPTVGDGFPDDWLGKYMSHRHGGVDAFECRVAGTNLLVHEHRTPDGGTLAIVEDVTERERTEAALRESEARLRAILDNSPASIHLKDTQGRLLVVNKEFERRNRVAAKEALGNTSLDLIPAESAERLRAEESWVIENRMPRSFERPLKYPDGETGIYLAVKFPVINASGTLVGVGSISTDVTTQKRMEEQARRLREDLAHVARFHAMGELAAGFAHEVNQPLAAISAYANGILKRMRSGGEGRDEFTDVMERIAEQALRAGNIVWRIYRFVRKTPSDKQPVDINGAIVAAIGMVAARAEAAGVALGEDLLADLPAALADPIQIQQVMINLFNNAIEAMSEGRERRSLTVTTRRAGAGAIEVSVADTGCGMTPEDQERLFQPFFTTKADGMGIGLLICQTVIEEHGGSLAVRSEPDRGTVVTFTLPAAGTMPIPEKSFSLDG